MYDEVPLKTLRPGAVFITHDGICAVKSQYQYNRSHNAQSLCILLENGEIAYFDDGNNTLVREIKCSLDPLLLVDEREAR
ncbi:hypothetical protein KDH_32120 [Dictyobacter sp. S3.2.2.5]|uniref:Uncharacterized protein n=1 Tax=Dictyobacter halimunensis TaxID=3026934 RepID=A0ABQ6FQ08_9CHLR|nr:hypothetical protein KDH_32120 [Dictyobacter sp. S3.2.2.5]